MKDFDEMTPREQDYEERAAIIEEGDKVSRAEAERRAAELIRERWEGQG